MSFNQPIREFQERLDIRVKYTRISTEDTEYEPALWIERTTHNGTPSYVYLLSNAYLLADDKTLLEAAFRMAVHLKLIPAKSTVFTCADILQKHIDDLVKSIPPAPTKSRMDIENMIDRGGYDMKIDGESIIH